MDGLGNSPQPTKSLGAFDAPAPSSAPVASTPGVKQAPAPEPQTTNLSLNLGKGTVAPSTKEVEIPKDVQWTQPKTVVQARTPQKANVPNERAVVTFVGDGDGLNLARSKDGSTINCRIDNINAPEVAHPKYNDKPAQAYGEEAGKILEKMVLNKEVTLRVSREAAPGPKTQANNWGRSLCQIEIEGKDVSLEMIQKGAAWLYRRYSNDPVLSAAEGVAKKNKVGLWANPNPIDPETYQHMKNW